MQHEKRTFRGVNTDHNEQVIPQGDYLFMENMRIGVSDSNTLGLATSVKGNSLIKYVKQLDPSIINYNLPSGLNTVIGCHEDKPNSKIYIFVNNSNGFNLVLEYNILTGLTLELLKDTPTTPFLNFNPNKYINHIDVYNRNLYWTDGNSEPKKLNLQNLVDGKYPNVIKEEHITKMTPQPLYPPFDVSVYIDPNFKVNPFYGRTYEFRYSWLYEDNELSGMSPASTLVWANKPEENTTSFTIKTGNKLVKKIFVYVRFGINNWQIVERLDKKELNISDNSNYSYIFRNNILSSFEDIRYANQNFMRVPIKAYCQSIIEGDRITYSNYFEDYDNVIVNGSVDFIEREFSYYYTGTVVGQDIINYFGKSVIAKGLKRGGAYQFGIVYYDKFGRHGGVNTCDAWKLEIPIIDNNTFVAAFINQKMDIDLIFNIDADITPPDWAIRYSIVRTKNLNTSKYIQFHASSIRYTDSDGTTASFSSATRAELNFNNIAPYYLANGGLISYDYTQGDRIRYIKSQTSSLIPNQSDFAILKSKDGYLTIDNKIGIDITPSLGANVFEIYTPQKEVEQSVFYETGYFFDIKNAGTSSAYHAGNLQDQAIGILPARSKFDTFDTYWRINTVDVSSVYLVESEFVSELYDSKYSDIGRGNVVSKELKQTQRKYSVTYSDRAILDTNINGFNQFYDDSYERYSEAFGEIKKTYYENRLLYIFFRKKVAAIPINQNLISDNSAQNLLATSDKVLNQMQFYAGEYGIWDNPESFAVYGNSKYFVDIYRGAVLRLSKDGITPISDYFVHSYWYNKSKTIFSAPNEFTTLKIFGVFDKSNMEYVVSISFSDDDTTSQTFAFSENLNRWTSYYTYLPENTCASGNTFVSFLRGKMYLHNSGGNNKFYDVFSPSKVGIAFNAMGDIEKTIQTISLNSNKAWKAEITNSREQLSHLIEQDFEQFDNEFCAGMWQDENTPYVVNPLFDGDDMRGVWTKVVLTNDVESNFVNGIQLYSVELGYVPSNFNSSQ